MKNFSDICKNVINNINPVIAHEVLFYINMAIYYNQTECSWNKNYTKDATEKDWDYLRELGFNVLSDKERDNIYISWK